MIHPSATAPAEGSVDEFNVESSWMSLADYQQYYGNAPLESTANSNHRRNLYDELMRAKSQHNKPVVNAEYAYFLRDRNGDGTVDKRNSHTRTTFRRASWSIAISGGYFVTGFGNTYHGGVNHIDSSHPEHNDYLRAEQDLMRLHEFFTQTGVAWWTLTARPDLVSGDTRYALANPIQGVYLVYTEGVESTELDLGTSSERIYSVKRYNPRNGLYTTLNNHVGPDPLELVSPDIQDWAYLITPISLGLNHELFIPILQR